MKKTEDLLRGKTSHGIYTMVVTRPTWEKKYKIEFWDQRKGDKSLVVINYPPKDKGTAFLKIGTTLWMYIPRVERIIRLPPSMMMNAWMGSDFTNDDLVKESSISRDYFPEILTSSKKDGYFLYTIKLTPKPEAPVVWGSVVYTVKLPGYIPLKALYFSERGELKRVVTFSNVKNMHGRKIPTTLTVTPTNKKGHSTTLLLEDVEFNVNLPDSLFSLKTLKKMRR